MDYKSVKFNKLEALYQRSDLPNKDGFCCDFSQFKSADYKCIYEPSEDSFIMIDALQLEIDYINNFVKPLFILEVGVGSGVVINSLQLLLSK